MSVDLRRNNKIKESGRKSFWGGFFGVLGFKGFFEPSTHKVYRMLDEDGFSVDAKNIMSDFERVSKTWRASYERRS